MHIFIPVAAQLHLSSDKTELLLKLSLLLSVDIDKPDSHHLFVTLDEAKSSSAASSRPHLLWLSLGINLLLPLLLQNTWCERYVKCGSTYLFVYVDSKGRRS